MTIRRVAVALVISAAMVLSGCGGGGGPSDSTPPASNNWDSMLRGLERHRAGTDLRSEGQAFDNNNGRTTIGDATRENLHFTRRV